MSCGAATGCPRRDMHLLMSDDNFFSPFLFRIQGRRRRLLQRSDSGAGFWPAVEIPPFSVIQCGVPETQDDHLLPRVLRLYCKQRRKERVLYVCTVRADRSSLSSYAVTTICCSDSWIRWKVVRPDFVPDTFRQDRNPAPRFSSETGATGLNRWPVALLRRHHRRVKVAWKREKRGLP